MRDYKEREQDQKTQEVTSDLLQSCFSSAKTRGVKADDAKTTMSGALIVACVVMARRVGFEKQDFMKIVDKGWELAADIGKDA